MKNFTHRESQHKGSQDLRYLTSATGGAMLGAGIAGVVGALIGGVFGIYIAYLISKKEESNLE